MRIEDVVESLNQYIEDIRKSKLLEAKSFLVLKRHIEPSEHFKAYKVAICSQWTNKLYINYS